MIKRWTVILSFMILFLISACAQAEEPLTLDFFYVNDLHGMIEASDQSLGIAAMSHFFNHVPSDQRIILTGGDMYQGGFLSNITEGLLVMEWMDRIGVDAAVLGNHEFDWGLDVVARHYNGTHPIQAQHTLLGANILHLPTSSLPTGVQPYHIIQRSGVRIGIIGTMGYGLESTILNEHVADYHFLDPLPIIEEHARRLRSEEAVDVVIVIAHDGGERLNPFLEAFSEEARIDAVFNGHTHQATLDDKGLLQLQAGGNGSHIGHLKLTWHHGRILEHHLALYDRDNESLLWEEDVAELSIIENYKRLLSEYFEPFHTSDRFHSRGDLTRYASRLMLYHYDVDFAFHNLGGTRVTLAAGVPMNYALIADIFPFNNPVVTLKVPGYLLARLIEFNPFYASRHSTFDESLWYTIALNAYLYQRGYYRLGTFAATTHEMTVQQLVFESIKRHGELYDRFSTDTGLATYLEPQEKSLNP